MAFGDPSYIVNGKILREEYPAYSYSENVGNAVVTTIYLAPAGEYYEQWELVIIYDINNNYSRTYISTSSDITGEYEFQIDSGDFSIPPGQKINGLVTLYDQGGIGGGWNISRNDNAEQSNNDNYYSAGSIYSGSRGHSSVVTLRYPIISVQSSSSTTNGISSSSSIIINTDSDIVDQSILHINHHYNSDNYIDQEVFYVNSYLLNILNEANQPKKINNSPHILIKDSQIQYQIDNGKLETDYDIKLYGYNNQYEYVKKAHYIGDYPINSFPSSSGSSEQQEYLIENVLYQVKVNFDQISADSIINSITDDFYYKYNSIQFEQQDINETQYINETQPSCTSSNSLNVIDSYPNQQSTCTNFVGASNLYMINEAQSSTTIDINDNITDHWIRMNNYTKTIQFDGVGLFYNQGIIWGDMLYENDIQLAAQTGFILNSDNTTNDDINSTTDNYIGQLLVGVEPFNSFQLDIEWYSQNGVITVDQEGKIFLIFENGSYRTGNDKVIAKLRCNNNIKLQFSVFINSIEVPLQNVLAYIKYNDVQIVIGNPTIQPQYDTVELYLGEDGLYGDFFDVQDKLLLEIGQIISSSSAILCSSDLNFELQIPELLNSDLNFELQIPELLNSDLNFELYIPFGSTSSNSDSSITSSSSDSSDSSSSDSNDSSSSYSDSSDDSDISDNSSSSISSESSKLPEFIQIRYLINDQEWSQWKTLTLVGGSYENSDYNLIEPIIGGWTFHNVVGNTELFGEYKYGVSYKHDLEYWEIDTDVVYDYVHAEVRPYQPSLSSSSNSEKTS